MLFRTELRKERFGYNGTQVRRGEGKGEECLRALSLKSSSLTRRPLPSPDSLEATDRRPPTPQDYAPYHLYTPASSFTQYCHEHRYPNLPLFLTFLISPLNHLLTQYKVAGTCSRTVHDLIIIIAESACYEQW